MSMTLLSPPPPITLSTKPHLAHKPQVSFHHKRNLSMFMARSAENGAGVVVGSAAVEEKLEVKEEARVSDAAEKEKEKEKEKEPVDSNGAAAAKGEDLAFKDPRWVGGTWDLKQFGKDGKTNWDAVIEAEARRRKWLEDNPESSSNENPVVFDTSIIPWWAWMKKYHLPEAELLNGRAAMIGFFMAYFVDSLTGVGLVGQMGNFFCKTLLFIAVVGVLFIRKNEDIETLKKLLEETTFYDKQWQATWKDDSTSDSKRS